MEQKVRSAKHVRWTQHQPDAHLHLSGVATGLGMLVVLYLVVLLTTLAG